ncbi:MAG: DNA topoisomerase I [Coxiellaceae bacterium]|nr:DNA topoisomerase I [Coxiellaceae bacterium]
MSKYLVIVESPAKCKTIKKYLGKQYQVMASYGHMRDLIPKSGAVEVDNDFNMHYQIIERNAKHVDAVKKALKTCDTLLLATDPDREGEAIAWHLVELLRESKALVGKTISRIVFHQITKKAVQEAAANPREISMDLVDAQQARRALDYLVGFTLSPLLWKKIRRGLSAGRVQSPALRLIVEREEAIEKFIKQEYWTVEGQASSQKKPFVARLTHFDGEKLEQFSIQDEKRATSVKEMLVNSAQGELLVKTITKKQRKRRPAPPFITSTLQQEASRKLGFTAQRTMRIAQQLYEGVDIGGEDGTIGLITYMRTDSVNMAKEALTEIRETILKEYGKDNLPNEPRIYTTKSKNAQEAHEAIRPTSAFRRPESLTAFLSKEQIKLYGLIWKRAIASQMVDAIMDTVAIDLTTDNHVFRANGSVIKHPGFLTVYSEDVDDKKKDDSEGKILPAMEEGDKVQLHDVVPSQHFTEPPPRYTEASLVKALEEHGIGRPSTYASIISTLQNREYVELEQKRFYPTDVGRVVNRFLTEYFTQYVDYGFTARLEDSLDAVATGDQAWIPVLEDFWKPFKALIDKTETDVQRSDVTQEKIDETCPECGKPLSIRLGRTGRFIGCTAFPDCSYTRSIDGDQEAMQEKIKDRACPKCQGELVVRHGKYGKFIGCGNYPDCRYIEPLEKPQDTGVDCPKCKQGHILQRKSRRGKIFFSCERYPKCDYAIWNKPIDEACPDCQWPILTVKTTKRSGTQKVCPQQDCRYAIPYPEGEENNEPS